jgi:hypothetical protein
MGEAKQNSMAAAVPLRIFLASPGDVAEERTIAREVVERLPKDPLLRGRITTDLVAWDGPGGAPMEANMTPQEAIKQGLPRPAKCDIVVLILWSRIGTVLPRDFETKPDGSAYRSGTEWEYLDALQAANETGSPKILVYRRPQPPNLALDDPGFDEKRTQWKAVQAFFEEFRNPDGSFKGAYNEYETPPRLGPLLQDHLKALVKEILEHLPEKPEPPPERGRDSQSALEELNALGALILKLHHFKSIADQLQNLYMGPTLRLLRSQPAGSLLPITSLKNAVRSGRTTLQAIRALDEPKSLSSTERKNKEENLSSLDAAVTELSTVAAAAPQPDEKEAERQAEVIGALTYQLTTWRDSLNKLAEESWNKLRLGGLGTTFARIRPQLSESYASYMARVDEAYRALTGRLPPLFEKCNLLAGEHDLLEKALKDLASLQEQLEFRFDPVALRRACPRIKGYLDDAKALWNKYLEKYLDPGAERDHWELDLLSSGKTDWGEIAACQDGIETLLPKLGESVPDRDSFLIKLREAQDNLEQHFKGLDEALAGAFLEVKNNLGDALLAVSADGRS